MGITKLMYINEDRDAGGNSHLKNALEYIMQDGKTEGGRLIGGGNCLYSTPEMVYQCFNQTKNLYGKTDGRQGYHYILSLNKNEGTPEIMMAIMKEFCHEHLGDGYEYVYCVHTDREHLHGHVIFNSVSRQNGLKYHYKQGDWKEYIQPITNRLCAAYGLSTIKLTKEFDFKAGNWKDAMREDIDLCRERASTYDGFLKALTDLGYEVHDSQMHKYLTLVPPGKHSDGFKGHRTNALGEAYSKTALIAYFAARVKTDHVFQEAPESMSEDEKRHTKEKWASVTYTKYRFYIPDAKIRRLYVDYKKNRQLIRTSYDKKAHLYKQDVRQLQDMMQKQTYLATHGLSTFSQVKAKRTEVFNRLKDAKKTLSKADKLLKNLTEQSPELIELSSLYDAYCELKALSVLELDEKIQLEDIKTKLDEAPYTIEEIKQFGEFKKIRADTNDAMRRLHQEKRILNNIIKDSERVEHDRNTVKERGDSNGR